MRVPRANAAGVGILTANPPAVTRAAADIGGTFTDVAVLTPDGRLATRKLPSTPDNYADAVIAGVRGLLESLGSPLEALECEVGAGGGSIAWLDKAGSLKVGPRSAGAVPGPACYDTGNDEPTVTDANVVLGYLNPESLAGGAVPIRTPVIGRGRLGPEACPGPLIIEEYEGTCVVPPDCTARLDWLGNVIIELPATPGTRDR